MRLRKVNSSLVTARIPQLSPSIVETGFVAMALQLTTTYLTAPLLASVQLARPECHVAILRSLERDEFIEVAEPIGQVVARLEASGNFITYLEAPEESPWQATQRWHNSLPEQARHPHLNSLVSPGPTRWFKSEADLVEAYHARVVTVLKHGLEFFAGQPPSWEQAYAMIAPLEQQMLLRDRIERTEVLTPQLNEVILSLGLRHYAVRVWERLQYCVDECNIEAWSHSNELNPNVRYAKYHAAQTKRLSTMSWAISAVAQARHLLSQDAQGGPYRGRDTRVQIDWEWEHERFMQVVANARSLRDFSESNEDANATHFRQQVMEQLSRAVIAADMGAMTMYLLEQVATLIHHEDPELQEELRAAFLAAQLKRPC